MTGNTPKMLLLSQYWVARGILIISIKMHIPKKALSSGTVRLYQGLHTYLFVVRTVGLIHNVTKKGIDKNLFKEIYRPSIKR